MIFRYTNLQQPNDRSIQWKQRHNNTGTAITLKKERRKIVAATDVATRGDHMALNLSERIAAQTVKKEPSVNDKNRATFLALREDIKKALDDGWHVKIIWKTLHAEGKIAYSYQAFRRYTNRLILSPPMTASTPSDAVLQITPPILESRSPEAKKSEVPQLRGFTYDATPKKEDLI